MLLPLATAGLTGCGMQWGALMYHSGLISGPKVEAEFTPAQGPILVLVDDPEERLPYPPARDILAEMVGAELQSRQVSKRVISNDRLRKHRRGDPTFDSRGCREVGREMGAEQVIWVKIQDCSASLQLEEMAEGASLGLSVAVVNALAENTEDVRLWPPAGEGKAITVRKSPGDLHRLKNDEELATALCADAAVKIGKLFYDHPMDEAESAEQNR